MLKSFDRAVFWGSDHSWRRCGSDLSIVSVNWPRAQPAHCLATVKKYGAYRFPCVQELSHFRGRPDDRMLQNEQEYAVLHATLTNSETTVESIDSVIFAVREFITHTNEGFIGMVLKTLIVLENVWFSFRLMCCHATDDSVHPISHDCAPWQNPSLTRSNTNNGGRIRKPKARRCAQFETNFTKAMWNFDSL